MAIVNRVMLKELTGLINEDVLSKLAQQLNSELSQQLKSQTNTDLYSTKTSLLTASSSGLRRPIRPKNSIRNESPIQGKFSKTAFTSTPQPAKKRAIFYKQEGDLPNLHSQDILNALYSQSEDNEAQGTSKQSAGFFSGCFENINRSITSNDLSNLKELQLYYCNVQSFRSLGTGWKIRSLTIIGSNITDFAGITGFASIEDLFVSFNRISDLSQLSYHQTIRAIDLEGNRIDDMDQIQYLDTIEYLEYVDLQNNPLTSNAQNRRQIENRLKHKLQLHLSMQPIETEDLWLAYQQFQQVSLTDSINQQLIQDRLLGQRQITLSLQQQHLQDESNPQQNKFSIYRKGEKDSYILEHLHNMHRCKRSLKEEILTYLNNKLSPENIIIGGRSRSKLKLTQIQSKEKVIFKYKDSPSINGSQLQFTNTSFRECIRAEAKKKLLIKKLLIKREGTCKDVGFPITESIKLRPGRSLLKSCLNKL